jgi:hypothetical protein
MLCPEQGQEWMNNEGILSRSLDCNDFNKISLHFRQASEKIGEIQTRLLHSRQFCIRNQGKNT